jgi:hypothetical protein
MNKLTLLVLLVLVALIADITIHTLPVRAQSSSMVYVDVVRHAGKKNAQLATAIKGSEVVAFSCANTYGSGSGVDCFILSK